MKIKDSKVVYSLGKNKGKHFYKVIPVFKTELSPELKKSFKEQIDTKIFSGDNGQQLIDEKENSIYLGLGEKGKINLRKFSAHFIKLGEKLVKWNEVGYEIHISKELSDILSPEKIAYQIANSIDIGAFPIDFLSKTYRERKTTPGQVSILFENPNVIKTASVGLTKAQHVSRHINGVRHIAHLPANHFTPEEFVTRAKEIASESKLKITVFDEPQLKKLKMGGILSVCEGSDKKPKMIILEYIPKTAKSKKKLAIIGKGLTFDAGGISLKPAQDMHEMKYDMCGAAATIHAIGAIAALKLPYHVIAAIGVAENMPDAAALKPGDVYTAYNGITVEVQNTDAEGRLVLGDVLSYVGEKYKPDYMVDLATLTGAVLIALGNEAAAILSNSPDLTSVLKSASLSSEDRVWELPLWEEYGEDLKSDIADVRNITGGRGAGTISAAQYLSKFVPSGIEWAHIDIAGTAWRSKPSGTQPNGPTGYGIRLLVDLVEELTHKSKS